ncbi:MAG: hypothetical protein U0350_29055 [Caldilineaceae bacterium]
MNFEEMLANCLDALERGETIESCLARYPQNAPELAPLLRLATTVRSTPQPRLSAEAFQRGRAVVRAQAQYHHSRHAPFAAVRTKTIQKRVLQRAQPNTPSRPPRQPRGLKPSILMYRTTGAFSALVLLLCLLTVTRNIMISLPGTTLYPLKILSENMEGVLLTAAGEQATWHAQQTENRLQELVLLTQQEQATTDDLRQTIAANVQATLTASNQLPTVQRDQFLLAWIERLQTLQKAKDLPPTVALTLENALATVKSATQITVAPVKAPVANTPTARPVEVSTPILVPTALPPTAPSTAVQQPPAEVTVNAAGLTPIEVTPAPLPTHALEEPVVVAPTPTAAQVVIQMPQENPPNTDEQNRHPRHTAQSPVKPTTDPVIAADATQPANSAAANAASVNSATANFAAKTNEVKASRAMTTSVDTTADTSAKSNNTETEGKSNPPTGTAALEAPPALVDTPTGAVISSPAGNDTPSPLASTTASSNNPPDGKNSGSATQTPEATVSTTATPKRTPTPTPKKTATPEKAVEPTDRPTDPPAPTATSADDDEPAADTPTSQPTVEATNTPNGGNHKPPGKK